MTSTERQATAGADEESAQAHMPPRHPRSASIMSSLTSAGARLPAWQTSNGGSGSGRSVDWLRYCSLFCSFLVALSAGSNYGFSAYSPQLQERLHLTSTQINIVGVMGNMGVYLSGPFWGRLVDRRGPKGPLALGALLTLIGYGGLSITYEGRVWETRSLTLLAILSLATGLGNCAAFTAAMNAQAKSWHEERRGLCTAIVLSGFGLSAFFYSTLSHTLFPGRTGDYLMLLAVGSSVSYIIGFFFIKIYPPAPADNLAAVLTIGDEDAVDAREYGQRPADYVRRRTSSDIGGRAWGHVGDEEVDESESDELEAPHDNAEAERQGLLPQTSCASRLNGTSRKTYAASKEGAVDLTGWKLAKNNDFIILFLIMTLVSGTGLLVINNIGTMTRTLYEFNNRRASLGGSATDLLMSSFSVWDVLAFGAGDVQQLQAHQVSAISIGNALGRIVIGLLSDVVVNRTGRTRNRVYLLLVVCALALGSQITAAWPNVIRDLKKLLAMSSVTGLMYGTLFGLCPVLTFEWFGLRHFSQNWGIISLSPVLAGNIFNLLFGSIYDSHVPSTDHTHICPDGEECFRAVFQITAAGAIVATGLSLLIIRRRAAQSSGAAQ